MAQQFSEDAQRIPGLLEYLKDSLRVAYISDLRGWKDIEKIRDVLRSVAPTDYSLREWNDAASYISDKVIQYKDVEEVKRFLFSGKSDF